MKRTVHLALLLGLIQSLVAEGLHVRSWHVEDGLPDGTVTALAQTPDGYLWVGTRKGLVRFDGARFVREQSWDVASPEDSRVAGLLVNRQGALWVAGETGLVMEYGRCDGSGAVGGHGPAGRGRILPVGDSVIARPLGVHPVHPPFSVSAQ